MVDGRIRKSDLIAFMRIVALLITKDKDKVNGIIDWAYSKNSITSENDVIRDFLNPNISVTTEMKRAFIKRFIKGHDEFPIEEGEYVIKSMTYKEFLKTAYWQAIAMFIKRRDGGFCQCCGTTKTLQVHHKTYENHGDELNHLGDLICLCQKCHNKMHKDE